MGRDPLGPTDHRRNAQTAFQKLGFSPVKGPGGGEPFASVVAREHDDSIVALTSLVQRFKHSTDLPIHGLDQAGNATIFHAGTREKNGEVVTAGGRVLSVCALGDTLDEARSRAYKACDSVQFDGKHFRRDIGKRREARKSRR